MFRHILVPIDDHPASAHAARHAYDLTRALGGQVTLLHVLEGDTPEHRSAAQEHLDTLMAGARRPPARVVLPVGDHDIQRAVASFAVQNGADLIVLGVSGEGGLMDDALGRFAASLARLSALPVHLAGGGRRPRETVPVHWRQVVTGTPAAPQDTSPLEAARFEG